MKDLMTLFLGIIFIVACCGECGCSHKENHKKDFEPSIEKYYFALENGANNDIIYYRTLDNAKHNYSSTLYQSNIKYTIPQIDSFIVIYDNLNLDSLLNCTVYKKWDKIISVSELNDVVKSARMGKEWADDFGSFKHCEQRAKECFDRFDKINKIQTIYNVALEREKNKRIVDVKQIKGSKYIQCCHGNKPNVYRNTYKAYIKNCSKYTIKNITIKYTDREKYSILYQKTISPNSSQWVSATVNASGNRDKEIFNISHIWVTFSDGLEISRDITSTNATMAVTITDDVYIGARGGKYYYTSGGNKKYI